MKKSINFWETSNMEIQIRSLCCPHCEGEFYEIDDHEFEECPVCHEELDKEPEILAWDSETYSLIVDHKTGVPSVIKMSEYEPVVREAPSSQTE